MRFFDLAIRVHGWTLVQVEGDGEAWCYTIGLLENFGHPELTLFDVETACQHEIVRCLVEEIAVSGRLRADEVAAENVHTVEVHADHLSSDLFGTWVAHYGTDLQPGEMLQVLLPPRSCCACHAAAKVRRLDHGFDN